MSRPARQVRLPCLVLARVFDAVVVRWSGGRRDRRWQPWRRTRLMLWFILWEIAKDQIDCDIVMIAIIVGVGDAFRRLFIGVADKVSVFFEKPLALDLAFEPRPP